MLDGDDSTWYAHPQSDDFDGNEKKRTEYQDNGAYRRSERTTTKKQTRFLRTIEQTVF